MSSTPLVRECDIEEKFDEASHSKRRGYQTLNSNDFDSSWSKFWIFPVVLLTTVFSVMLIIALHNHWTLDSKSYAFVVQYRATVSIIVQVVSGLLGVAHVATIRTLMNYYSREKLCKGPLSLDQLNFWSSLTTSAIDWQLPARQLWITLSIAAISLIPSALWAGALTPISVVEVLNTNVATMVPVYSNASASYWHQNWYLNISTLSKERNDLGIFSYAPQLDRIGSLYIDGASASGHDGSPQLHKKNDNSNFTYRGRSYGVAALVGLVENGLNQENGVLGYSFNETGYVLDTKCIYNYSSSVSIDTAVESNDSPIAVFHMHGVSPVSPPDSQEGGFFVTGVLGAMNNVVAILSWSKREVVSPISDQDSVYISMLAGSAYTPLNRVQCRVSWRPTHFVVDVDVLQRSISVSPDTYHDAKDMDPSGTVAIEAGSISSAMCMISTTLFTSVLGNMFMSNVANVLEQKTLESNETKTLRAIEESLSALHDAALVARAGAQLFIANDTAGALVVSRVQSGQIGQGVYIYAISVISIALLITTVGIAIRSRGWRELPRFNFVDIRSVVIGTSAGGSAIWQEVQERERGSNLSSKHEYAWIGDAGDKVGSDIQVMLTRKGRDLSLRLFDT